MQCPIHGSEMYEKEGKYGKFWSHKTDNGDYCNGKIKGQTSIVPPPPTNNSQSSTVSKEVWEQKDRLYAAQTSLNCVAQIYQGHGDKITDEMVEKRFKKFYSILREAKMGIMSRPVKENPPEIPLEEIPF